MTVRSQGRVQWFTDDFSVPLRACVLKCTPHWKVPRRKKLNPAVRFRSGAFGQGLG